MAAPKAAAKSSRTMEMIISLPSSVCGPNTIMGTSWPAAACGLHCNSARELCSGCNCGTALVASCRLFLFAGVPDNGGLFEGVNPRRDGLHTALFVAAPYHIASGRGAHEGSVAHSRRTSTKGAVFNQGVSLLSLSALLGAFVIVNRVLQRDIFWQHLAACAK